MSSVEILQGLRSTIISRNFLLLRELKKLFTSQYQPLKKTFLLYMYKTEIQLRVRYAETDRMGYVYYGNYATYFEVARVESLRNLGFTYKAMEDNGFVLPVLDYSIKYFKPAYYDDLLTIFTTIIKPPAARLFFEYETYNEKNELLNKASTTLVFISRHNMKPCVAPEYFVESMKKYFVV
jgi:acyl-CoA thioester hydrolase